MGCETFWSYLFRLPLVIMSFVATGPIVLGITIYEKMQRRYMQYVITRHLHDHYFVDIQTKNDSLILCKYADGRRLIVILADNAGMFPMHVLSENWLLRTNVLVVCRDYVNALADTTVYDFSNLAMERPIMRLIGEVEKLVLAHQKIATCDGWYGLVSRKFFIDEVGKERVALDS